MERLISLTSIFHEVTHLAYCYRIFILKRSYSFQLDISLPFKNSPISKYSGILLKGGAGDNNNFSLHLKKQPFSALFRLWVARCVCGLRAAAREAFFGWPAGVARGAEM